jgi:putative oxidoreductase
VTPLAATALIAVMTAATLTVNLANGFFVTRNGYEYNLVLVATLFALAAIGAGNWSLDSALGIDLTGTLWAVGALGVGGWVGSVRSSAVASRLIAVLVVVSATLSATPPELMALAKGTAIT